MFTIDLEQSLVRNKRKLLSKEEVMVLDKMKTLESMKETDVALLKELGMWSDNLKTKNDANYKLAKHRKFRSDRVFHEKDIKNLCQNYGLRFLQSEHFNGELDCELPNKIREFEQTYSEKVYRYNSYIAAPAQSFKLQERPQDPLFFVHIGDNFYYLVHKWGNDISVFRWLTNLPVRTTGIKLMTFALIGFLLGSLIAPHLPRSTNPDLTATIFFGGFFGILFMALLLLFSMLILDMSGKNSSNMWIGNNEKWDDKYI